MPCPTIGASMLQFQQIRCFVALAQELHFGRAAERLHMTQPPFSRQIRLLEAAVGQPLFVREPRAVSLTEAGRRLLPEAEHLMRCSEAAGQAAQDAFKGLSGTLVLGYVMGVSFGLLPELVAAMAERLPGVTLTLHEISSDNQREALRRGRIDLALARSSVATPDLGATRVLAERFEAALPRGHRLAHATRIGLHDLDGEPMLMYQPGRADRFHDILQACFDEAGVAPRCVQHVRHGHAMLPLVDAGIAMALVPASLRRMRFEQVQWRPADLPPSVLIETHMAWRLRDDRDNPVVAQARHLVMEAAAALALRDAALATAPAPATR